MPSLHLPLIVRSVILRALYALIWKSGMLRRIHPWCIRVETVRELLLHLDCPKSLGPDGLHTRVLRELVRVIADPLSTIYQCSWLSGEV